MKRLFLLAFPLLVASCISITTTATTGLLPRHGHATVLVDGAFLVMTGSNSTEEFRDYLHPNLVRDFVSSTDGVTWSTVMPLGPFYGTGSAALCVDGRVIANAGAMDVGSPSDIIPNFDTTIFSNATGGSPPWGVFGVMPDHLSHYGLAYFHGRYWILGGNRGAADESLPYGSANIALSNAVYSRAEPDSTWTQVLPNQVDPARWGPRDGLAVVVFQDKLWVLGGRAVVDPYALPSEPNHFRSMGDVWSSPDGRNWTLVPQGGDSTRWEALGRAFHQVVVLDNALYLTGGFEQNPKYAYDTRIVRNDIQRSVDGSHWYRVATFSEGRYDHTATVKGGSIYLIGGRDASQVFSDVVIYTPFP